MSEQIVRLFTSTPSGLDKNTEVAEQLFAARARETIKLAELAIEGHLDEVKNVLNMVAGVNPGVAFNLGMNVVNGVMQLDPVPQATQSLQGWLTDLVNVENQVFTEHDRLWLEGKDLDYLDEEALLLHLMYEEVPKPKRTTLFTSTKSSILATPNTSVASPGLSKYSKLPDTKNNRIAHDHEVRQLVIDYYTAGDFAAVVSLLSKHQLKTEKWKKSLGLVHDMALHFEARKRLRLVDGGSVDMALAYVASTLPWTEEGLELVEAFKRRISNRK